MKFRSLIGSAGICISSSRLAHAWVIDASCGPLDQGEDWAQNPTSIQGNLRYALQSTFSMMQAVDTQLQNWDGADSNIKNAFGYIFRPNAFPEVQRERCFPFLSLNPIELTLLNKAFFTRSQTKLSSEKEHRIWLMLNSTQTKLYFIIPSQASAVLRVLILTVFRLSTATWIDWRNLKITANNTSMTTTLNLLLNGTKTWTHARMPTAQISSLA